MRSLFTLTLVLCCSCSGSVPSPRPLPPDVTFAGNWDSNWGKIVLRQRGRQVNGRYTGFRNGSLSGTVEGDLFRFRWTQDEVRQHGRGYLQLTPDGMRMEGRWGYLRDAVQGGRWWAQRAE
jgi:hypothetical protein